jgi:predicted nucleic acid-binding protein
MPRQVLFDLNVLLDVFFDRPPFADASARALACVEKRLARGFVCAASLDTLHDLLRRGTDKRTADRHLATTLALLDVADVTGPVVRAALSLGWDDFEGAVVYECARQAQLSAIVTRNPGDFRAGEIRILSPEEFTVLTLSATGDRGPVPPPDAER